MSGAEVIATATGSGTVFEFKDLTQLYDEVRITFRGTTGSTPVLELSSDNGATWETTGYRWHRMNHQFSVWDGAASSWQLSAFDNFMVNIYSLGLAHPPIFHAADLSGTSYSRRGYHTGETVYNAFRITFASNFSGTYEIVGTPATGAEIITVIDFSANPLTTTPVIISGLDKYASLRGLAYGCGVATTINYQVRPLGGEFLTGTTYKHTFWYNGGVEGAQDLDYMQVKTTACSGCVFVLNGFGITGNTAQLHGLMGGEQNMYHINSMEASSDAEMDAIQLFTHMGTINTGKLYLSGELKSV